MWDQAQDREWRSGGSSVHAGNLAYSPAPILPQSDPPSRDTARSLIRDRSDWSWASRPAI